MFYTNYSNKINCVHTDTTVLSLQEISAATKEPSGGFVDIMGHFAAYICGKHEE